MITQERARELSNEELLDMLDTSYHEYIRTLQGYGLGGASYGDNATEIRILRAEALRRMAPPSVDVPF
jgi:hypothetical protein